jgi:hypothetical protein
MLRQNRLPGARVSSQPGIFISINAGFIPSRPPVAPSPPAINRVLRIVRWMIELVESRLVEDAILIAALGEFERAMLEYLDTRP